MGVAHKNDSTLLVEVGVAHKNDSTLLVEVGMAHKNDFTLVSGSLMPTPRAPPGEKRSGERSRISWAYSPKR